MCPRRRGRDGDPGVPDGEVLDIGGDVLGRVRDACVVRLVPEAVDEGPISSRVLLSPQPISSFDYVCARLSIDNRERQSKYMHNVVTWVRSCEREIVRYADLDM